MGRYWKFELSVFREAWGRTWKTFAPTREHAPLYIGLFLVGSLLDFFRRGLDAVLAEAQVTLTYGLGAIGLALLLTLGFNLVLAPYRLWVTEHGETPIPSRADALARFLRVGTLLRQEIPQDYDEWKARLDSWVVETAACLRERFCGADEQLFMMLPAVNAADFQGSINPLHNNERLHLNSRLTIIREILQRQA